MVEELVERLTTNYTYFMREPEHFRLLNEKNSPRNVSEKVIQHFTTYGVQGAPQGRNATRWPCC